MTRVKVFLIKNVYSYVRYRKGVRMYFVINQKFMFFPVERKLQSLSEPELTKILATPASNCLLLLLKHAPEIVSHKTLLDEVWGKDGIIVPLNTLSQNISIARKGIRAVSNTDDEVIVTVSRKGFRLHAEVEIISEAKVPVDEAVTARDVKSIPGQNEQARAAPHRQKKRNYIFVATGVAIISSVIIFILLSFHTNNQFFSDYTSLGIRDGCHYFGKNWGDIDNKSNQRFSNMIQKTVTLGISCQKYPWVYLSKITKYPISTAIYCQKEISTSGSNECMTMFFYKEVK